MDVQRLARQEEQWAEMLFGGQPDAVLIHRRGRIAYANESARSESRRGRPSAGAVGREPEAGCLAPVASVGPSGGLG